MEEFSRLFEKPTEAIRIVRASANDRTLEQTPVTQRPNAAGLLFVPLTARGKFPVIWTPNQEYAGDTIKIAAETKDLEALVAYVQKLGTNRGRWRDLFQPLQLEVTDETNWAAHGSRSIAQVPPLARSPEWIAYGKEVYERRCIGCHGAQGDGNGPAATFLYKQRPRNFRLTKEPLPTDADLLRTITRGVRGTAMPPWYDLPLADRLAVIHYIKYELALDRSDPAALHAWFVEEPPGAPYRSPLSHRGI
jgi:cytochrome c oxidase cbb3-type subunit 2